MAENKSTKPRCAVISTWQISCGIATFAEKMVESLKSNFEVDVFPLEQSVLKSNEQDLIKLGNQNINKICSEIRKYDLVNVQFEPGILGSRPSLIFNRLRKIISASKCCYVTMHTVKEGTNFRVSKFLKLLPKSPTKAIRYLRNSSLNRQYINFYKWLDKKRTNTTILFHTKSSRKYVNIRYPGINTLDFPLCFIDDVSKKYYEENRSNHRNWLIEKYGLNPNDILISSYGFISEYKGFETAIRAINILPLNYKLLIFGSLHPNAINEFEPKNNYLEKLIRLSNPGTKKKIAMDKGLKPLDNKVVFAGNLEHEDFEKAINGSDVNVFSYLEVGQTSSGPIAISLDLKKKTLATNNRCFNELKRYAKGCFDQFDIGNHVQLSELIKNVSCEVNIKDDELQAYNNTYKIDKRADLVYDTYFRWNK